MNEIATLSEFLVWVENARPHDGKSYALFYRGHADAAYRLEPTVYRRSANGESFRSVEHTLYEEMLRHATAAFHDDRSVFERTVRMQHHGLPTRLLDLTHSPLIALYFACSGQSKENGEVMFFPCEAQAVLHPSDVPEAAFVGIERKVDFLHIGNQALSFFVTYLEQKRKLLTKHEVFNLAFLAFLDSCTTVLKAVKDDKDFMKKTCVFLGIEQNLIPALVEEWEAKLDVEATQGKSSDDVRLALDAALYLAKFVNDFKDTSEQFIQAYCEKMPLRTNTERRSVYRFLSQFTFHHFAYPPINNERIRRQQGAFIISPPVWTAHWPVEKLNNPMRVRVQSDSKGQILKELSYLGITESYVFPELTVLAGDIKLRYPATLES